MAGKVGGVHPVLSPLSSLSRLSPSASPLSSLLFLLSHTSTHLPNPDCILALIHPNPNSTEKMKKMQQLPVACKQ